MTRMEMTPNKMKLLENFIHLPSKFNFLSLINKQTLKNDDSYGVIPKLIEMLKQQRENPEIIVLLNDERGHLLSTLKNERLTAPR